MDTNVLINEFASRYGKKPDHIFFCPGRVNLIGEHIDYNGGRVMPAAVSMGTWLAVSKNTAKELRFHCLNFPETATLHLQPAYSKTGSEWFNYPLGVIHEFVVAGHALSGLDLLFFGNLPIGAGLSSSASIEVLTGYALNSLFGAGYPNKELALMAKKAENEFIGVNCGIMDQFAVAMGKKEQAILLNCDTVEHEYLPFQTGDYRLLIINSNKQRNLADSKYNERFAQCGAALKALKEAGVKTDHLCGISLHELNENLHHIGDPVLQKRAKHVVSENERVSNAAAALNAGKIEVFGELMYASHDSLQQDYEVSGRELDTIVAFSRNFAGCIGARMTGAGFGGCAIALVHKDKTDEYAEALIPFYTKEIGYAPSVYPCTISDGVSEIVL